MSNRTHFQPMLTTEQRKTIKNAILVMLDLEFDYEGSIAADGAAARRALERLSQSTGRRRVDVPLSETFGPDDLFAASNALKDAARHRA